MDTADLAAEAAAAKAVWRQAADAWCKLQAAADAAKAAADALWRATAATESSTENSPND